jgi:hypothetical protein
MTARLFGETFYVATARADGIEIVDADPVAFQAEEDFFS